MKKLLPVVAALVGLGMVATPKAEAFAALKIGIPLPVPACYGLTTAQVLITLATTRFHTVTGLVAIGTAATTVAVITTGMDMAAMITRPAFSTGNQRAP